MSDTSEIKVICDVSGLVSATMAMERFAEACERVKDTLEGLPSVAGIQIQVAGELVNITVDPRSPSSSAGTQRLRTQATRSQRTESFQAMKN